MTDESMSLADRIRTIIDEMDGPEYGKKARLADIAKCSSRSVVNHWLSKDQQKINGKHALAIANALGYRVEWIMEGKGPKKKGDAEGDLTESGEPLFMVHVTSKEMQLLTAYRSANAMDRALFEHLCQNSQRKNS